MRVDMKTSVVMPVVLIAAIGALIWMIGILGVKDEVIGNREAALRKNNERIDQLGKELGERDKTIHAQAGSLKEQAKDLVEWEKKADALSRDVQERDQTIKARDKKLKEQAKDLVEWEKKADALSRDVQERDQTIMENEEF